MPIVPCGVFVLAATLVLTALAPGASASPPREIQPPPHLALWMEPGANLPALSTVEGIRDALDEARAAGVDVVMPEAKTAWGYVTYRSGFAPTIDMSPISHSAPGTEYPPPARWYPDDFDMLGTIITEAHARGLRVHAAVNTFGEGYTPMRAGPAFLHPSWQAIAYVATRRVLAPNEQSYALSGVDVPREAGALVLYTPAVGAATSTSRWGAEVSVDHDTVTEVRDRASGDSDPGQTPIPRGGYVLSGNGEAADWLLRTLQVGTPVHIGPVEVRMEPSSGHSIFAFVNPADPTVWNYEMAVIYEILTHYDVDGIVLDRTRYQDVTEDFSELSRAAFEQFIGHPVAHWPDDIYTYVPRGYWVERHAGPLYQRWLGYRAHTVMAYTRSVAALVHTLRPRVALGMYVGSWYPVYYNEGVNWASPSVSPPYRWISPEWVQSGLAPLLDYLMIGLYYRPVTIREAAREHYDATGSIEGGAELGLWLLHGDTPLVGALLTSLYDGDPQQLTKAIQMSDRLTCGTMLFDLVYLNEDHLWQAVPPPSAGDVSGSPP
jgi:uncharacterized lipoprotein YddW (UPF0748 family)